MDFDAIAKAIGAQFVTAWNAPIPFLAALLAAGFLIRLFYKSSYAERLETKDERIKYPQERVDDYKDKLSGATPEEAKAKISALEERVAKLSRQRELKPEQVAVLTEAAKATPWVTGGMSIFFPVTSHEAATYAKQIAQALSAGGWYVDPPGYSIDGRRIGPRGMTLSFPAHGTNDTIAKALVAAFDSAGIEFKRDVIDNDEARLFVDVIEDD